MADLLAPALGRAERALNALDRARATASKLLLDDPLLAIDDLLPRMASGSWGTIAAEARRRVRELDATLVRLDNARAAVGLADQATAALAAVPVEDWPHPAAEPGWPARRRAIEQELRSRGRSAAAARSSAEAAGASQRQPIIDAVATARADLVAALASGSDDFAAAWQAWLLLAAVAETTRAATRAEPPPSARVVRSLRTQGDGLLAQLWAALDGDDDAAAEQAATQIGRGATVLLLGEGAAAAGAIAARRRTRPDTLVGLAIDTGDATRSLLLVAAAGHVVSLAAQVPGGLAPWRRSAALPERTPRPVPSVAVAELASGPKALSGRKVSITGVLGPVTITHRYGNAMSTSSVRSGAASVPICLPYIKLDSAGLVPGAAVTIEGTWRLHHFLADGPTLVVSRHGSADDARRDRASALLHLVRYAYAPVPHGLSARWSWEPGFDGAANQLCYRTVAAQRPRGTTTRGPR